MKTRCKRVGWVAILGVLFATFAALAQEEYSGAFYFGEASPGDGVLGPGDIAVLKGEVAIPGTGVYSGCNPAAWDVQELDGDGVIGPGDLNLLVSWVAGNFATGDAGKPFVLEPVAGTHQVEPDLSAVVCVQLSDNPANGDMIKTPRPGWGVNFAIDPASTCATATLSGRDPTPVIGAGKNQFVTLGVGATVFDYTSRIGQGGQACFTLNAPGCMGGLSILVNYYVPGDAEALFQVGSKGRFPTSLNGTPSQIPVAVIWSDPDFLTVLPDPASVDDGASIQMTATDFHDGDVTASPLTTWSIASGPCTVNATGKVITAEGCANAACVVQADYLTVSDIATVNVTDNEVANQVSLNCSTVSDEDPIQCAPSCSSTADGCPRACACTPTCTYGCCGGNITCHTCSIDFYLAECVEAYGTATDDAEVYGTWDLESVYMWPVDRPSYVAPGGVLDFECHAHFECDMGYQYCEIGALSVTGCPGSSVNYIPGDYVGGYLADPVGDCVDRLTMSAWGLSDGVTIFVGDYPAGLLFEFDGSDFAVDGWTSSTGPFVVDGHTVELAFGATAGGRNCFDLGGGNISCWIRLINRDSDEYMNQAFMVANGCVGCMTATVDNADIYHGDTTKPIGGLQPSVPVDGAGLTYAEKGVYVARPSPYNEWGGPIVGLPTGAWKPAQTLHPACGSRAVLWDFGGQTSPYSFAPLVQAEWRQWNPLGSDGVPGGVGDDPLYNFQDYTTTYLVLTALDNLNPGRNWYKVGAYKRSTHLAGYGSAGNVSGVTILPGRYFAMNLAVEYPNRIEAQPHGIQPLFPATGYEYYNLYAVTVRYNPFALERVKAQHKIGALTTLVYSGMPVQCAAPGTACVTRGQESWDHLEPFMDGVNSFYATGKGGWVGLYRYLDGNFGRDTADLPYKFDTPAKSLFFTTYIYEIEEAGHKGIAHFDKAKAGMMISTGMYGPASVAESNWMVQDGPDADPDLILNLMYMYALPTASGLSSELRVEVFSSFTQFNLWHTGLTFFPSGPKGATSDDWSDYCAPFSLDFPHYCDPAKGIADYAVYKGTEKLNPALPLGGFGGYGGGGGVQAWNVYVCVQ